jgi:hypothetical protein
VAPEQVRGDAPAEHQAVAATAFTAFTALIDTLSVSLIGLQPGGGLRYGAVILGGVGLSSSGLAVRLWRARASEGLSRRWPYLLGFIIVVYAVQVISGRAAPARGGPLAGNPVGPGPAGQLSSPACTASSRSPRRRAPSGACRGTRLCWPARHRPEGEPDALMRVSRT